MPKPAGLANQRPRRWLPAAPLGWSAYVLWRTPEWGLLHGIPLTPVSATALFSVWWVWAMRRKLPATGWVWILLIAKVALGPLLVPRGLHASYFSNGSWQGQAERGRHGAWPKETRIDSAVAFGHGFPPLPVFFLNDTRFNRPGATRNPLSIEWTGYRLVSNRDADLHLYLSGRDVTAEARIDGFTVVTLGPDASESTGRVRVRPGLRRLSVTLSSASGAPEAFEAGSVDPSTGAKRPFSLTDVFQRPVSAGRIRFDLGLRAVSGAGDLIALMALTMAGLAALRETFDRSAPLRASWQDRVIRILPPLAFADALAFSQHTWNRVELLGWGTDRLAYESAARDIVFHGPLMTLGAPLGQGAPFYYQPLYSYFLALVHAVAGEGLWGVYLCQRLGLAVTAYALWSTAALLFGAPTMHAAAVLAVWFAFVRLYDYSAALYTESLFIPLICAWTLWLCREAARPGTVRLGAGAVLGGLSTLARSTLLAAWAPVGLVFWTVYRRARQPVQRLVVLFVLTTSVVGLATVRNWIVAGRFVPISSSLADNLYMGNQPALAAAPHVGVHAWTDWITNDARTRAVVEYAYHAPAEFALGLLRKTAYALGLESILQVTRPSAFVSTIAIDRTLPWIWIAALVGGLWLLSRPRGSLTLAQCIPAVVALSHLAVVVAIFPYSERLVLPFYALLVPYAAVPFGALASRVRGTRRTLAE